MSFPICNPNEIVIWNIASTMKGIYFTITTFIILLVVLSGLADYSRSNWETSSGNAERIASERVFYNWYSISDNVHDIVKIRWVKIGNLLQINDTLPEEGGVSLTLGRFQRFIEEYYEDPKNSTHKRQ